KEPGNWGLHNILLDRRGELHLIYTNDAHTASARTLHEKRYDIWHLGSTEGRKKWPPPRQVRQGYYGSMLSVIELDSGRIVLPICYLTNRTWSKRGEGFDAFTYMGQFSSSIMYSDDRGETWHQSGVEFKAPTPIIHADG